MKVSVVIPTWNEAESIEPMLKELPRDVVDEVIVVDAASEDGTPDIVKRLGYRVIPQEGRGYGAAMHQGALASTGDVVVLMDADGSYDPKEIPTLVKCIEDGYDVAFASRYMRESGSADDTVIRYVGNKLFTFLLNFLHGVGLSDSLFLYIAARREVFETLPMETRHFEYCIEFPIKVKWAGLTYTQIPSFERKRFGGQSKVVAFYHGVHILRVLLRLKFRRRKTRR